MTWRVHSEKDSSRMLRRLQAAFCLCHAVLFGWISITLCVLASPLPALALPAQIVVNGHILGTIEDAWLRFVADNVAYQLQGDAIKRTSTAAVAAWWGLKEGTFSRSDALRFSSCNFGPNDDRLLTPTETCAPGRAWQVGLAAVQVPNHGDQEILQLVESIWPGKSLVAVIEEAITYAGIAPNTGEGVQILASSGLLRRSWLLRHPVVGLALVQRDASAECFSQSEPKSWCFGTGWDQSRWYAANAAAGQQSVADLELILRQSGSHDFKIAFPLERIDPSTGRLVNAYTAHMSSVFDHKRREDANGFYCASSDSAVVAYTGEIAASEPSAVVNDLNGSCGVGLKEFSNSSRSLIYKNGGISSVETLLSYDSHPGYDYPATKGTDRILAAAGGQLVIPASDPINGGVPPYCKWHTFLIRHDGASDGSNWETWYLHADRLAPRFANLSSVNALTNSCKQSGDLVLGRVAAGEHVAYAGDKGVPGASHLHLEVRRNGRIVDPYGWEWLAGTDPIGHHPALAYPQVEPLWEVMVPKITSIALSPSGANFNATVAGEHFDTAKGVILTLWDASSRIFVGQSSLVTPQSPNVVVAPIPATAEQISRGLLLKVKNEDGPRSTPVALALTPGSDVRTLTISKRPAPGGGTFFSFASFHSLDPFGAAYFEASIDINADDLPDDTRLFRYASGNLTLANLPGSTRTMAVLGNNSGDVAYAEGTPGQITKLFLLRSGASAPIQIASRGQVFGSASRVLQEIRGPLALSESGDVAFSGALVDEVSHTSDCCSLFVYLGREGRIATVVKQGSPSPLGGTLNFSSSSAGFTNSGELIFATTSLGSNVASIFGVNPSVGGIRAIVAAGSPAPAPIRGRIASISVSGNHFVSGDLLAARADIVDGDVPTAILRVNSRTGRVEAVAAPGGATRSNRGGAFSNGAPLYANNPFANPHIQVRADGTVAFNSRLTGASGSGSQSPSPSKGVFLWSPTRTDAVLLDGDPVAGGLAGDPGAFIINDAGAVVIFVPRVQ